MGGQGQLTILIAIVNYRSADLTVDCLRSLSGEIQALPPTSIVIVDNASGDASAETLRTAIRSEGWNTWAEVLASPTNLGFAGGNNAAIRHYARAGRPHPDYVLLLNPDTVVRPGGIRALVDFLERHPQAGIAGGNLEDANGRVESAARRLPNPLGELDSAAKLGLVSQLAAGHVVAMPTSPEPHRCGWISGACMLVRRGVFESIGLMDEEYFLYYEEVDFCARAGRVGWECWYVPGSCVLHLEGSSTGIRKRGRRGRYWYDSRRRFFVKTHGVAGLILADAMWSVGRAIGLARRAIPVRVRPNTDPLYFAWDLLWGDLRSLFSGEAIGCCRHPDDRGRGPATWH